jgi:hypothetical protein
MSIDYKEKGKVRLSIFEYIYKVLQDLPHDMEEI